MAKKILTKMTYIGGRLRPPGTEIEVDDKDPTILIAAPSTPVGNMTDDELEAYMRTRARQRAEAGEDVPQASGNVAAPGSAGAPPPPASVPMADVAPRSAGTTMPQGLPPGATLISGEPTLIREDGSAETFTAPPQPDVPNLTPDQQAALDLDRDGGAGGSLTVAEIKAELDALKIEYPPNAKKAELQKLLSAGPQA